MRQWIPLPRALYMLASHSSTLLQASGSVAHADLANRTHLAPLWRRQTRACGGGVQSSSKVLVC